MARNSKHKNQKKAEMDQRKSIIFANMKFVKFLGSGSFGSVNLLRYREPDGSMFYKAVKISGIKRYDSLDREFHILSKLRGCPNIVQCFGNTLFEDFNCKGKRVCKILMEYAAAGTLTDFMKQNKKLSDSIIKDFTRMILEGLVSIHSHGYVHCDLKPDNLLLFLRNDCSYDLKISDFGISAKAGEKSVRWKTDSPFVGTPIYMSPESVQYGIVEKALDLWSLGCIVLEMYIGKRPWWDVESAEIRSNLLDNIAPEIPDKVPCDARKFLETCFARKPEERGSASELLLHPFLTEEQPAADGERNPLYFIFRIIKLFCSNLLIYFN